MSANMRCIKKALIRDDSYPVGTPAPLHVNCACGQPVPITKAFREHTCTTCGTVYDSGGWIVKPATEVRQ